MCGIAGKCGAVNDFDPRPAILTTHEIRAATPDSTKLAQPRDVILYSVRRDPASDRRVGIFWSMEPNTTRESALLRRTRDAP